MGLRPIVLELGSNPLAHLPAMEAVLGMTQDAGVRVEALQRELEDVRAKTWAEAEGIYREIVGTMIQEGRINFQLPDVRPKVEPDAPEIGAHLKRLRQEQGLSQRDLADKLGCDQASVSRMERRGHGEHLAAALKELDPDWKGDANDPAAIRQRAAELEATRVRAEAEAAAQAA